MEKQQTPGQSPGASPAQIGHGLTGAARWRIRDRAGPGQIMAFRGYGNDRSVFVHGYVPAASRALAGRYTASRERSTTDQVTLHAGREKRIARIDERGLYAATVPARAIRDGDQRWLDIVAVADVGYGSLVARHPVTIPAPMPELIVIWDLDDTLDADDNVRTLAKAAASQTAALCAALWRGPETAPQRPLFILSALGWDHYYAAAGALSAFALPSSPLLMHPESSDPPDGASSKAAHLRRILDTYPRSPALLVTSGTSLDGVFGDCVVTHAGRFAAVCSLASPARRTCETLGERLVIAGRGQAARVDNPFVRLALQQRLITPECAAALRADPGNSSNDA